MRIFYAWLLLVLSTVQWIGGHICFEVAYFMEVEQVMSEPEHAISSEILKETGIETSVNILPEGQHVRWGADYGNYFAYSKADSSGTVFYTIDYAPRTVTWEQVAGDAPEKQQGNATKTTVLKHLFSEFLFPSEELPNDKGSDLATANFQVAGFQSLIPQAPLSPPPNFFC